MHRWTPGHCVIRVHRVLLRVIHRCIHIFLLHHRRLSTGRWRRRDGTTAFRSRRRRRRGSIVGIRFLMFGQVILQARFRFVASLTELAHERQFGQGVLLTAIARGTCCGMWSSIIPANTCSTRYRPRKSVLTNEKNRINSHRSSLPQFVVFAW